MFKLLIPYLLCATLLSFGWAEALEQDNPPGENAANVVAGPPPGSAQASQ